MRGAFTCSIVGQLTSFCSALPPGEKIRCVDIVDELSEEWKNMSKSEKVEKTREDVEELKELRDERQHAPRNTNMAKFHDARANLVAIHHEV